MEFENEGCAHLLIASNFVAIQHKGGFVTRYAHCCAMHARIRQVQFSMSMNPSLLSEVSLLYCILLGAQFFCMLSFLQQVVKGQQPI